MEHWTANYINRKYVPETYDCVGFVEQVMLERFSKTINMEAYRPSKEKARAKVMERAILTNIDRIAVPSDKREEGMGVLMIGAGSLDHIGILVYPARPTVPYVLHNFIRARHSVMTKVNELCQFGLKVEGYYEWI